MTEQNCKHTSFACEQSKATGVNFEIGIVRCSQCGTAIGVLYPQVPTALYALGEKLDALQKTVQNLSN